MPGQSSVLSSDKRMHIRLDELVQDGRLESADSLCHPGTGYCCCNELIIIRFLYF